MTLTDVIVFLFYETCMILFAAKSICQWLISWVKCCKKSSQRFQGEQLSRSQDNTAQEPEQLEPEPQNTIVEDITITEEEQGYVLKLEK